MCILVHNCLLGRCQACFRAGLSTNDQPIALESYIKDVSYLRVKKLSLFAAENRFNLNPAKRPCVLFSKRNVIRLDSDVKLNTESLPEPTEHMFLGVGMNEKFTCIGTKEYVCAGDQDEDRQD